MVDDLNKLSGSSKKISFWFVVGCGEMAHIPVVAQFPVRYVIEQSTLSHQSD